MYESFYQLAANPFRLAPDPDFCFTHSGYKRAREYLEYALAQGEGFVMVTGRPGTGKTMLAETFLRGIDISQVVARRITASNYSADDLLRAVAYAYELDAATADKATLRHLIQDYFLQQEALGRRVLLIIDEAQALEHTALEELRIMADLQTQSRQMLQLFLIGQESLQTLMRSPEMEQFQQRVIANYHLVPLDLLEVRAYIEHRLIQAGWQGDPEFTATAVQAIHQLSRGVPRHINKICNRLMLLGYGKGSNQLDEADVRAIADEMQGELLAPMEGVHPVISDAEQSDGADVGPGLAINLENLDDKARAISRASRSAVQRKADFNHRHAGDSASWRGEPVEAPVAAPVAELPLAQPRTASTLQPEAVETPAAPQASQLRLRHSLMAVGASLALATIAVSALPSIIGALNGSGQDVETVAQGGSPDTVADVSPPVANDAAARAVPALVASVTMTDRETLAETAPTPATDNSTVTPEPAAPEVVTPVDVPAMLAVLESEPAPAAGGEQDFTGAALNVASITYTTGAPRLDVTPVATATVVDDAVQVASVQTETDSTSGRIDRGAEPSVQSLLADGQRALNDYRLMTPADDNAYMYFRTALQQDPGNAVASSGIDEIVDRYVGLSRRAVSRGEISRAQRYIDRGLSIEPGNRTLLALQDNINRPFIERTAPARASRSVPEAEPQVTLSEQDNKEDVVSRITDFFRKRKEEAEQGIVTTPAGWDG